MKVKKSLNKKWEVKKSYFPVLSHCFQTKWKKKNENYVKLKVYLINCI